MRDSWVVDGYQPYEIHRSKSGGRSKLLGGDGLVKLIKQLHAIDPGMAGDGIFRTRRLVDDIKEIHPLVKKIMVEVVPGWSCGAPFGIPAVEATCFVVKWDDHQPLVRFLDGDAGACCSLAFDLCGAGLDALAGDELLEQLPALFPPPIDVALVALHLVPVDQVPIDADGSLHLVRGC